MYFGTKVINMENSQLKADILGGNGMKQKKCRIRKTKNLSTDADNRTNTVLERLRFFVEVEVLTLFLLGGQMALPFNMNAKNLSNADIS